MCFLLLWVVNCPPPSHFLPPIPFGTNNLQQRASLNDLRSSTYSCRNEGITDFLTIFASDIKELTNTSLDKLIVAQPFQKLPTFYGNQMFSTVVFWVMTLCSFLNGCQFGTTYCLHLWSTSHAGSVISIHVTTWCYDPEDHNLCFHCH